MRGRLAVACAAAGCLYAGAAAAASDGAPARLAQASPSGAAAESFGDTTQGAADGVAPDPVVIVPSPQAVVPAQAPDASFVVGAPLPPVDGVPSLVGVGGGPPAQTLVDDYVVPRLAALSRTALALQNGVLRTCAAGTGDAERDAEQALDAAALAAAQAAGVDTIRPEAIDLAVEVLVPVANTEASRTRFDAISRGSVEAPRSLAELALEQPGLAGLPALELLLRRIAVAPTKERCALALAAAANVRMAALRRENAFRSGTVAPHWDQRRQAEPTAGRQRLRDLVEALLLALDGMDRDLAQFAELPGGNRALPFLSAERMQAFLASEAGALVDHVGLIQQYLSEGSEPAGVASEVEVALGKVRDSLARPGPAGRARRTNARTAFGSAQAAAVTRLPEALGFEPSALRRPIAAYAPAVQGAAQ